MILSAWLCRERGFVYCFFQECIDARYWKQKVGIELNKREFFFNNRSSSSFEIAAVEFFLVLLIPQIINFKFKGLNLDIL